MFASTEQVIIDRLREKLPDVTVEPLRELERVPELRQKAPAVFVIYDGYGVGEFVANGSIQKVTQDWFVVVAAKSAKGNGKENTARDQAAELCESVLSALLGFHLGGGRYLRLADAPGPEYDAGYCHVPLAFTCAATFKGQP
jgi:phage gp37-like protein